MTHIIIPLVLIIPTLMKHITVLTMVDFTLSIIGVMNNMMWSMMVARKRGDNRLPSCVSLDALLFPFLLAVIFCCHHFYYFLYT